MRGQQHGSTFCDKTLTYRHFFHSFGSLVRSSSTGIIFNNGMNDFSNLFNIYGVPPSKWNKMAPHKTPRSYLAPAIVTRDNGDVAMVIGASGGPRIPMAIAQVCEIK